MRTRFAPALLPLLLPRAPAQADEVSEGRALVEANCSSCHAIGMDDTSPLPAAPPFRELHRRYDVSLLSEALVEGIVTGHPEMPQFEFEPNEAQAIISYLRSLETDAK